MSTFVKQFQLGRGATTVAIKDTIDVAGFATQAGSRVLADAQPAERHADVVEALLASGRFTLVGKTNLHELAFGVTGVNDWTGTPVNPLYPELIPGGSSSGSAVAVASAEADVALGTDTGGSIRMPAACCGVYGLKPTFGRISRRGVMPTETSLDCVGPMARCIDGLVKVMSAIDPRFDANAVHSELPLGLLDVPCHPDIAATLHGFLGASDILAVDRQLPGMEEAFQAGLVIINRESWRACAPFIALDGLGDDIKQRLLLASETSDRSVAEAEEVRATFTEAVDRALDGVSALVLPTLPNYPMTRSDALAGKTDLTMTRFVRPFNLSGHPALTVPLRSERGLSVGLQLVGRKGDDEQLCRLAQRLVESANTH